MFNVITGPLHWELLIRSRSVDNQFFVAACAPARTKGPKYESYGNSMVSSPMGQVKARADHEEKVVFCDIDLDEIIETRRQIPIGLNLNVNETI